MAQTTKPTKDTWSATEYNNTASFVYSDAFIQPVLDLLQPRAGERIVDFGCGSGEVTKALMDILGPSGLILGLDSSESMIMKAKDNGVLHCRVMDVQIIEELVATTNLGLIPESFDAVFSNAALHWCKQSPSSVVQNAWNILKPGGRFVAEMGGFTNIVGLRASLHRVLSERGHDAASLDPWYFPSDTAYRKLLEKAGFKVESIGLFPRMTYLSNGLKPWLELFTRQSMLSEMSDTEAEEILEEVVKECEVDMKNEQGQWCLMYVRLRFKAIKQAN